MPDVREAVRGSGLDRNRPYPGAAASASPRTVEAAIIDVLLPDEDGVEVCRRLREWSEMPILVLSGVQEEREKVRALQSGADDYVLKPFSPAELVARLEAALRRVSASPGEPVIALDGLKIDLAARLVRVGGHEVDLTPIEYDLLRVLALNPGKLMSHRSLLLEVWGPGHEIDRPTLRFHVSNLRKKIEPSGAGQRYIRTEPGLGYRFATGEPGADSPASDRLAPKLQGNAAV